MNDWSDRRTDDRHATTRSRVTAALNALPGATVWDNTYRGIGVDIDWTHAPALRSTIETLGGTAMLEQQTRARYLLDDLGITAHTQAPLLDTATKVANQLIELDTHTLETIQANPQGQLRDIAGTIADAATKGRTYTFGQAATPTNPVSETLATLIADSVADSDMLFDDTRSLAFHLAVLALQTKLPTTASLLEDRKQPEHPNTRTPTRHATRTAPKTPRSPGR